MSSDIYFPPEPQSQPDPNAPADPNADPMDAARTAILQAVEAGAIIAKAYATGEPEHVWADGFYKMSHGIYFMLAGLTGASPNPPSPADHIRAVEVQQNAAATVLSHEQQMAKIAAQRDAAATQVQRAPQGRPSSRP